MFIAQVKPDISKCKFNSVRGQYLYIVSTDTLYRKNSGEESFRKWDNSYTALDELFRFAKISKIMGKE